MELPPYELFRCGGVGGGLDGPGVSGGVVHLSSSYNSSFRCVSASSSSNSSSSFSLWFPLRDPMPSFSVSDASSNTSSSSSVSKSESSRNPSLSNVLLLLSTTASVLLLLIPSMLPKRGVSYSLLLFLPWLPLRPRSANGFHSSSSSFLLLFSCSSFLLVLFSSFFDVSCCFCCRVRSAVNIANDSGSTADIAALGVLFMAPPAPNRDACKDADGCANSM